jgi:cyanate permease
VSLTPPRSLSADPRLTFVSLSLLFFLVSAGAFSSLGVVLPAMVAELKWNWTQAGMGYTLLGVACGLASFLPAILIRRIGVSGAMGVGTLLLVGGFGLLATAQEIWQYLGGTLMIGTAFALTTTVPGAHVLTGMFKRQSTVLGAYFTSGALGGVAGPLLYVVIHSMTDGWRAYWWVLMGASAVVGLFAVVTTPGKRRDEPAMHDPPEQTSPQEMIEELHEWTVRRALAAPQFYVIVGAYTMYLLINTTAHGFAVEHLTERGVDAKAAAGMLSIEALIGAVVSIIGGIVGEKVSSKSLMIFALVCLTIGMEGLTLAKGMDLNGILLMGVYAVGVGIGFGLTFIASTLLLLKYFGRRPNLELYSIMCLISTTAALGPAFGGWMRDKFGDFILTFELCTLATLIVLVATLFIRKPTPRMAPSGVLAEGGPAQ